mgnify:CR=1 FL=1
MTAMPTWLYRFLRWCPGILGLLLRQRLYPCLLGHCGRGVLIGRHVDLINPDGISLGNQVIVNDGARLDAGSHPGPDTAIDVADGAFIGAAEIRRRLDLQGLSEEDFGESLRRQLLRQSLESLVGAPVSVSDAEVEREFRRRNEQVKLEYVLADADRFRAAIQPTEDEIKERFEAKKDAYRIPEKRVVSYVLLDRATLQPQVTVTDRDIEMHYLDRREEFRQEEEACASHILVKVKAGEEGEGHLVEAGVIRKGTNHLDLAVVDPVGVQRHQGACLGQTAKEHDASSLTHQLDCQCLRRSHGIGADDQVGAEPAGHGAHQCCQVFGEWVTNSIGAKPFRHGAPRRARLGHKRRGAACLCDSDVQAADGAGSHDDHDVAEAGCCLVMSGEHRAARFGQGGVGE